MTFNASSKLLKVKVEWRSRQASSWVDITNDIGGGVIEQTWDRAHTASLRVLNANGKNTGQFHPGDRFRVFLGLEALPSVAMFDGVFAPGTGTALVASPGREQLSLNLVSHLGRLTADYLYVGKRKNSAGVESEVTFKDQEVGMAIRELVLGMEGAPLAVAQVRGTDPLIYIRDQDHPEDGLYTRWQLLRHFLEVAAGEEPAADTSLVLAPRRYRLTESLDMSGNPTLRFFREPDPETAAVARNYQGEIGEVAPVGTPIGQALTISVRHRRGMATRVIAQAEDDESVYEEFSYARAEQAYGLQTLIVKLPGARRDTLWKLARRAAYAFRRPARSVTVTAVDAFEHRPGQVIRVLGTAHGLAGRFTVTGITTTFSDSDLLATLNLSRTPELPPDLLAAR